MLKVTLKRLGEAAEKAGLTLEQFTAFLNALTAEPETVDKPEPEASETQQFIPVKPLLKNSDMGKVITTLRDKEGLSWREIGSRLNVSHVRAWQIYKQAKKK